ncbi:MAG: helix-turn-helix domain-containing protein [Azonexus sp.]|jgi:cytoskeleton protein RodZ|nr:helix-turn-helix domain-containing protein [Azonexus sp.]
MSEADITADATAGKETPPVETVVAASPPSVGEQLAAARLARGLKVVDVAQTLKLSARQVVALEGDNWQALPGPTFIRGFVRNYARLLGLDAAPLMAMLDQLLAKPTAPLTPLPARRPPMGNGSGVRRDRLVMLTGGLLLLLAALAYFLIPGDLSNWRESAEAALKALSRPPEAPAAPPAAETEPPFPPETTPPQIINPEVAEEVVPTPVEAPPATPASPESAAIPVGALRLVADQESWVEVHDRDSRLIFSQRMTAGSEQVLNGPPPLSLVIGYAPGVRLTWRGKAVDLGPSTKGDVARLALE